MLLLLKLILLTSIWCLGVKIVTSPGMLLHQIGEYGERKVEEGKRIFEAIVVCEFCLPSIHSLFGYFFAIVLGIIPCFSWVFVLIYPLVAIGSSIVSGFTWTAYKTLVNYRDLAESKIDFYDKNFDQ